MAKKGKVLRKLVIQPISTPQATLLWKLLSADKYNDDDEASLKALQAVLKALQNWGELPSLSDWALEKEPENIEGVAEFLEVWASALRGKRAEIDARIAKRKAAEAKRRAKNQPVDDDDDDEEEDDD